jgi:cysteine-S-conjugate beta-lyase
MVNPLHDLDLSRLRRRTSMKWRGYPEDVLPMWVAEMDADLAPPVAEALREAIAMGDTGYACGIAYAEAAAGFAARRWGWDIDVARTSVVPDVMLGMCELLKLITRPGDVVALSSPVYHPFYMFLHSMGLKPVEAPLTPRGRLDMSTLEHAFAQAKVYLLCSPHNPVGTVHTRLELAGLAMLAREHGVRVISDEIHAPLTLPWSTFTPWLTVPGAENGFALLSASKAWNLAGLKAAVAIAGEAAAADLARMPEEVGHGMSHFGAMSHVAGLRFGGDWLDGLLSNLDDNRRLLASLLAQHLPSVRYSPPEATYLAWLDCRELDLGEDPAAVFLERGRVALNNGAMFGTGGAGHVRMNIGTSPELITEGVRRMASAL